MNKRFTFGLLGLALAGVGLISAAEPVQAQSVGYVTGFPGRDPADDDAIGWGPAYRPETSFAQPGTPPTPGQLAARGYYERYGRPVYPSATGSVDQGYYAGPRPVYGPRRVIRHRGVVTYRAHKPRRVVVRHRHRS